MTIKAYLLDIAASRPPDFIIGGAEDPYMLRWYVIPRNPVFNIYLHCFLRSDDDGALHDHSYASLSIILLEMYKEHTTRGVRTYATGDWRWRLRGSMAHRIELFGDDGRLPCWTLFITGPRYRQWGFHCPNGWRHWSEFTSVTDSGSIGKGCE